MLLRKPLLFLLLLVSTFKVFFFHRFVCLFDSVKHHFQQYFSYILAVSFIGTPVSSTYKTDCHDITEILLKVALNTIKPNQRNLNILNI